MKLQVFEEVVASEVIKQKQQTKQQNDMLGKEVFFIW